MKLPAPLVLLVLAHPVVHAAVVFNSSSVAAGGFHGGYTQNYVSSTPLPLATTPSTTTLLTISNTWENDANTNTSYSQTMTGGLVAGGTVNNATFGGSITLIHDPGLPRDGAPVWFGSAEPFFDLVLDSQSTITATIFLSNLTATSNGTEIRFQTMNIYTWSWGYLQGSNLIDTTASTYNDTWQTTLGPGSYRFAPFAGINSDSGWSGANATLDYQFNVAAIPEPSSGALLLTAASAIAFCRRRRR